MGRKMKDSGVEWIGEIPEEWRRIYLFQALSEHKNKNEGLMEKNLLSLSYGKIKRKEFDSTFGLLPASFEGYNIIECNDIVLRLTDLQNDHKSLRVGIGNERGIITSAYLTLRNKTDNSAKYLFYLLHTFDVCKGFYGMGAGVRQGLNWQGVKHLELVIAPLNEQNIIAKYLDDKLLNIDDSIVKIQQSIDKYKSLKQSLITLAVTKGVRGKREMKDSGIEWIGEIPAEWILVPIKSIGKTSSGATPLRSKEKDYFDDANIPWIRTLDLNEAEVYDSSEKITQEALNDSSCSIMPKDTVCVAMYGGAGTIGKCGLLKLKATTNQAVCSIVCNDNILPKFLLYHLVAIRKYWMYYAVGTRKDPNISQDIVARMKIVLPTFDEQQEIVNFLDEKCNAIDTLIEKKEQLLTELEAYKKSLIYEYVTGKREVLA